MSGLSRLQLEEKILYRFKPSYKKELSQHLSEGYEIVDKTLFMTALRKVTISPIAEKKFHIELDGLICDDDTTQDKLEKLSEALWNTCKTFKNDGIEIHKLSTPGVKDDEQQFVNV